MTKQMAQGVIFDIKEFTVHDGPGIRVTVFFKGCPLRCNWCHNPEGLSFEPELFVKKTSCINCGKCHKACAHKECEAFGRCLKACPKGLVSVVGYRVGSGELAKELLGYRRFLELNHGGITLSGGEPLAQPDFLLALLSDLMPIHTAVETSGYGNPGVFEQVIELADLILFDIKHMDSDNHKRHTGVGNELIQRNLLMLMDSDKPFIARIPLIPGVNDTEENLRQTASALDRAKNLIRVELLPYNPFAGAKYGSVQKEYAPQFNAAEKVRASCAAFEAQGICCKVMK